MTEGGPRSAAAWTEAVWLCRAGTGASVVGPVTLDQIRRGIEGGRIEANAQVQRVGTSEWVPVSVALSATEVARAPAPSVPIGDPIAALGPPGGGFGGGGGGGMGFMRDLFKVMDGLPAHAAILLGLLLVLLSPVVSRSRAARAEAAAAELQHAQALMDIDFDEFVQSQGQALAAYQNQVKTARLRVAAAQASRDGVKLVLDAKMKKLAELRAGMPYRPDPSQQQALDAAKAEVIAAQQKLDEADTLVREEQIKAAEAESKSLDFESKNLEGTVKALEDKKQQLLASYNIKALQRAEVDARTQSQGGTATVHLQWMGRMLFLVGVLVLTLNAAGAKQKIGAAVLLLSLFAWLTPAGFELMTRVSPAATEATPAPAVTTAPPKAPRPPSSAQ